MWAVITGVFSLSKLTEFICLFTYQSPKSQSLESTEPKQVQKPTTGSSAPDLPKDAMEAWLGPQDAADLSVLEVLSYIITHHSRRGLQQVRKQSTVESEIFTAESAIRKKQQATWSQLSPNI